LHRVTDDDGGGNKLAAKRVFIHMTCTANLTAVSEDGTSPDHGTFEDTRWPVSPM
jgi:hypothetical protein